MNDDPVTWPEIGGFFVLVFLVIALSAFAIDIWKTRRQANQGDQLRELVNRYEVLASNTMDLHQRVAADLSELRSRTSSIEQILRTVD
jgi:hypothetical protein